MCGDLEEEDGGAGAGDALYHRFLMHARTLLSATATASESEVSESSAGLHVYMDKLFADALGRCAKDAQGASEPRQYETMAAQALVFARLAGFLAGHTALQEDPLRKTIEALMVGYAEAEDPALDHGHDHSHDHGHGHHH